MKTIELSRTQLNTIYNNMYQRCYNEKVHKLKPYYKDCTMCDEWKNDKESFYQWVNDGNFYEIDGEPTVHLDKDILVKGNLIYSPDTCIFAPASINELFGGSANKQTTDLPKGVKKVGERFKPEIKGYLENYSTIEEAWEVYRLHRQAKIISTADKYLGKIPYKLYEAMLNWKLEITD